MFRDRRDAGRQVAARLLEESIQGDLLVLALPRGGVPVAVEAATALSAPLDVLVVRKLGAPFNPELALGAIALGGITVWNEPLLEQLNLSAAGMDEVRERESEELARRECVYRGDRPLPDIRNKVAIVVDDGIATGATMEAAVKALRRLEPAEIIVAVPSAARDSVRRLGKLVGRVIAVTTPDPYLSVGSWYQSFPQLTDAQVVELLKDYWRSLAAAAGD